MSQSYFWPPAGGGSNASVGTNGNTAPTSATEIGFINGTGQLTPVSPTTPLPATVVASSPLPENLVQIAGNAVTAGAGASSTGTQRIILASDSPLAPGASTSANQATANTSLASIDGKTPVLGQALAAASVPVVLTSAQLAALTPLTTVSVTQPVGTNLHTVVDSGSISVSNFPATQPVSGTVAVSSLSSGGNTLAIGTSGNIVVSGASAVGTTPTLNPVGVAGVDAGGLKRNLLTDAVGRLEIDTVQSLPLPAGASTSALQTSGNASLTTIATNIPPQGQALAAASTPVVLTALQLTTLTPLTSVTVTQATGTNLHTVVDSSVLPTGASTSANQATANTSLASIDSKTPALGQALAAASVPVVLTATQLTTLTPLTSVTVVQPVGTSLHAVIDSGSVSATPTKGTITDGSGTTSVTPSTATTAVAANATRKYLYIQNTSPSATIWINFTTTAVTAQPSIPLLPYAGFVQEAGFVSTEAISVISTTASAPYTIKQA